MKRLPLVSWVLRVGVILSAILLVAALVDTLVSPEQVAGISPSTLMNDLAGLGAFQTPALVHLGLVILLITPIARVAVLLTQFARERDTPFVLMSLGVLFLLALSVWLSLR